MIIRCAWCKKILGEKPPYEDKSYTDTICEECLAKHFPGKDFKNQSAIKAEHEHLSDWWDKMSKDDRSDLMVKLRRDVMMADKRWSELQQSQQDSIKRALREEEELPDWRSAIPGQSCPIRIVEFRNTLQDMIDIIDKECG